jgi:hypothetical protein
MGDREMIVKNILICEDIRQEVGNKLSLMGVLLGSAISIDIPSGMPKDNIIVISLACLISMENSNQGNELKDFKVQISMFLGDNKIGNMTAKNMSTGKQIDRISHIPVPKFEFGIKRGVTKLSIHAQIIKNETILSESSATLDIILNGQK